MKLYDLLKFIPGFRTGVKYKKIIAILYYLFALLMFVAGPGAGIFFLAAPFTVFSFVDLIRHKKKAIPFKKAVIPFIVSFALMIGGMSATTEPMHTDTTPAPSGIEQVDSSEVGDNNVNVADSQNDNDEEENTRLNDESDVAEDPDEIEKSDETEENTDNEQINQDTQSDSHSQDSTPEPPKESNKAISNLKVHFIDVGQGDCALVHTGNAAMLIDAGNRGDGPSIVSYIKNQGIQKLDYLILTHPHADHIGGAAEVVKAFEIDKILMPKATHTSKTFEELLVTIQNKGLKITSPSPGDKYSLGNAEFQILACNDGSDLNNKSIVNRLVFGNTSFLFTGDAESSTESIILSRGFIVDSDVLKVGHHGSDTSTTSSFLKSVSPKYAVISVGNNSYGHPTQAVLERLASNNIEVYRTDEAGTIIATSDGDKITFDKKASTIKQSTQDKQESKPSAPKKESETPTKQETKPTPKPDTDNVAEVYITNTGKKYHANGCRYLSKSKIPISKSKAISSGYEPCKVCKP